MQQVLQPEIAALGWSVVLLLVHIVAQGLSSTLELGPGYNLSSRDDERRPSGVVAGRCRRALANYLETYPAFIALALGLVVAEKSGGYGQVGAWVWLTSRATFLPLYALGVSYLRTLAWVASLVGLVMMLARLLT